VEGLLSARNDIWYDIPGQKFGDPGHKTSRRGSREAFDTKLGDLGCRKLYGT